MVIDEPALEAARAALHPERFGFEAFGAGWVKEFPGFGRVAFGTVGWPHARVESYDYVQDARVATDALGLIANLQGHVWGFPPELVVPTNVMAIIPDSGGATLIAYRLDTGFNADGWIAFAIGLGARNGTLVSHMLAVREEARGASDFGWHLKLIQAYEALQSGHHAMIWTFDPMRGGNARLNLEKLGATVHELTLDKYGVLRSAFYQNAPSDRFTARWDLGDRRVHARIAAIRAGTYTPLSPRDIAGLPEATVASLSDLLQRRPQRLRYRIPGDIDRLMRHEPERGVQWRREMRTVLSAFLTTKSVRLDDVAGRGPISAAHDTSPGDYAITGFATGLDDDGERQSYYILERPRSSDARRG